MSLPNSVNAPVEKQRTNIYTVMLMLSFLALVTGSILFSIIWSGLEQNPPWNTSAATPRAPGTAAPAPAPAPAPVPAPAPAPAP